MPIGDQREDLPGSWVTWKVAHSGSLVEGQADAAGQLPGLARQQSGVAPSPTG